MTSESVESADSQNFFFVFSNRAISAEDGTAVSEIVAYCFRHNIPISRSSLNASLNLLMRLGKVEQAEDIIRFMRSAPNPDAVPDIVSWNVMMCGYSRNGMPEKTLATFGGIIYRRQSEKPTISTFNAVLQALLNIRQHKSNKSAGAQFVVRTMGKLKVRPWLEKPKDQPWPAQKQLLRCRTDLGTPD
mmetsp:Transcript_39917/g.158886  ORF Transcript_39917/g.158886 Transcript_39917/m.158886 type:complete len:188 (+) Transcript_39917:261-824(+)